MDRFIAAWVATALCLLAAVADGQSIQCLGSACNGPGTALTCTTPKDYMYLVTLGGLLDSEDSVCIGTHDPNLANYSSFCMPPGWSVDIIRRTQNDYRGFTGHGNVSTPTGQCPYSLVFRNVSGPPLPPLAQFALGFDHARQPHDVDWKLAGSPTYVADWSAPVGLGAGPVHSPIDECITDSIWIGTGYDPRMESVDPIDRASAYWKMFCDPDPLTDVPLPTISIIKNNSWKDPLPNSQWISSNPTDIYEVVGIFCFDYFFCLNAHFNTITLDINLRADDRASVYLNGNLIGSTPNPSHNTLLPTNIVITNLALFNPPPSSNHLEVEVENTGFPGMGLNLAGYVKTDSYALSKPWCCDSSGMIVGVKWNDIDDDGQKDPNEPVLPGWEINLINDDNVWGDITDGNGRYSFAGVVPGSCYLFERLSMFPGWCQTYPPNPGHYAFSLLSNKVAVNMDFGNRLAADINGDGIVNIGDAVYLINFLFRGGPAPIPAGYGDFNCDSKVNIGDAVYLINYLFRGGPPPCCP